MSQSSRESRMSRFVSLPGGALCALLVAALLVGVVGSAQAQEEGAGSEPAKPIVGNAGLASDVQVTDPADQVVVHITSMTRIVRDHMDEPDQVKSSLKAYLDENGKAMKEAGDRFEAKLNELSPDEREAYKQKLQRKMESALAEFLEAMLDFSERHPAAARELDELLKAAN